MRTQITTPKVAAKPAGKQRFFSEIGVSLTASAFVFTAGWENNCFTFRFFPYHLCRFQDKGQTQEFSFRLQQLNCIGAGCFCLFHKHPTEKYGCKTWNVKFWIYVHYLLQGVMNLDCVTKRNRGKNNWQERQSDSDPNKSKKKGEEEGETWLSACFLLHWRLNRLTSLSVSQTHRQRTRVSAIHSTAGAHLIRQNKKISPSAHTHFGSL